MTTLGPLTAPDDVEPGRGQGRELPPLPRYATEVEDRPSPVQVLLDDLEADRRVTGAAGRGVRRGRVRHPRAPAGGRRAQGPPVLRPPGAAAAGPAAAARPRRRRPPRGRTAGPGRPRPGRRVRVDARAAAPARPGRGRGAHRPGRRPGRRRGARRAGRGDLGERQPHLAGAGPAGAAAPADRGRRGRRVFAARSSEAWVDGLLPLGDEEWVVLDADPDAAGLKLDQHTRTLARHYASEANGDPATSAPATLRSTGFALARRGRADEVRARVQQAEALAADDGTRELLLDDLVRGVRVEVWDDATRAWHSLHRRRVTVTGRAGRGARAERRAGRRVPPAVGAQPGRRRLDGRVLPARGRRRVGRLEPVRTPARADRRARRAAGTGRADRAGRGRASRTSRATAPT